MTISNRLYYTIIDGDQGLAALRAHEGDAGLDVRSAEDVVVIPGSVRMVRTGIRVRIPFGYGGLLMSRSGHSKESIRVKLANSVGLIDHLYTGELILAVENCHSENSFIVRKYDRLGQLVVVPVLLNFTQCTEAEYDFITTKSTRGAGGFGSTNTN